MIMRELLGKPVAEGILAETKNRILSSGIVPGLGVVLVGDDPASRLYVGIKERKAAELGFRFDVRSFPATATEGEVSAAVGELNADGNIHGIIVQLPLPAAFDTDRIIAAIDPAKDADGFHPENQERFLAGARDLLPVFPQAMLLLARSSGVTMNGASALGVVRSARFQKVFAEALRQAGLQGSVYLDTEEEKWRAHLRTDDFIFTACGVPERLSLSDTKDGAVVIDGGIVERNGATVGDVDGQGHETKPGFFSPVPGGVGPVTVACLLFRVSELALLATKTTR